MFDYRTLKEEGVVKSYRPMLDRHQFDGLAGQLRGALESWYRDQMDDPEAPPSNPNTAGAFGHLPEIDSKSVVTASPIIREILGVDLDPKLIRKGGYTSFDDLAGDLLPKLRESCPSNTGEAGVQNGDTP